MTVIRMLTSSGWLDLQQGPPGPPGEGGGGVVSDETVDTFESYKIIMFSDGTVRAVPVSAFAPAMPTGFVLDVRLSSVRASWAAASGASQYAVFRGGVQLGLTSALTYRDIAITVGSIYTYQVQAVNSYGMRSAKTAGISAFIDPADNSAPIVSIRAWPPTFPSDGQTILRVNARDVDAQVLAHELEVSAGTITATNDPTVWIYTP